MIEAELRHLSAGFATANGVEEITVAELSARLAGSSPAILLIDARTPQEQSVSALAGAVHVSPEATPQATAPLQSFLNDHGDDPEALVVVYCAAGARSARLAARIQALLPEGGVRVRSLQGGLFAWAAAGHGLVQADSGKATRRVHGFSESWSRLVLPPGEVTLEPPLP